MCHIYIYIWRSRFCLFTIGRAYVLADLEQSLWTNWSSRHLKTLINWKVQAYRGGNRGNKTTQNRLHRVKSFLASSLWPLFFAAFSWYPSFPHYNKAFRTVIKCITALEQNVQSMYVKWEAKIRNRETKRKRIARKRPWETVVDGHLVLPKYESSR